MANLKYLDIGQCLLLLVEIMRHILDSPNNNNDDDGNIDVFFFQLSKPQTDLKTPAKQNGMNIKLKLREDKNQPVFLLMNVCNYKTGTNECKREQTSE